MVNKILDLFFSKNLDFQKRMFFIFIAIIICIQSLSSIVPYRKYFDTFGEAQSLSSLWGYANDINFDFQPFKNPIVMFDYDSYPLFNSEEAPIENFNNAIQENIKNNQDNMNVGYYTSQYRLATHLGSLVIKATGVKNLKIIKAMVYMVFLSFSLISLLLILLFLYNRNGSIIPLLIAPLLWTFVETDFNIWYNFGLGSLPLVLLAIYFHYQIGREKNISYYLKTAMLIVTLFTLLTLHSFEYITLHAASFVAIYLCFVNIDKAETLLSFIKKHLKIVLIISLAVIIGLLLALLVHWQIVPFEEWKLRASNRSISDVGNAKFEAANHYRPSILEVLQKCVVPILLMVVIPISLIWIFVKNHYKYLLSFILLCPFTGWLIWQMVFPNVRNHVPASEQALYIGMVVLLLVASHKEVTERVHPFLQNLLK